MSFDLVARLKLQDDFSDKMRRVSRHMSDAERKTRSLSSSVGGFGRSVLAIGSAIGVTAAISKGFGMVRESVGRAFDRIDTMEQFERVMNVMIGDTEKVNEVLENTREIVTGTAYTLDGAAASVQNFVTRGVEVDKATGYLAAWGDAVAFYGDGSQEQFDNVNDALGKMLGKGKVTMDQLDRIMHAGIPAIDLYADKMNMNTQDVSDALSSGSIDAEEFVDTITEAMAEGGDKFGSIAGAARDAGASWGSVFGNMRTHIATGVEDIIKSIDSLLEDSGLPDMREMVKNFGETFRDVLKGIATRLPAVVNVLSNLTKIFKPWIPLIKQIAIGLITAVGALTGFSAFVKIIGLMGASLSFLVSPIGLLVLAITGIAVAFQQAVNSSANFKKRISDVIDVVKDFFSGDASITDLLEVIGFTPEQIERLSEFTDTFKEILTNVGESVSDIFSTLWSVLQPIFSALGNAFKIIGDIALMVFSNVIAPVLKLAWTAFQTLWKIVGPILKLVGEAIGAAFEVLKVVWNTIIKPVTKFVTDQFKKALESLQPVLDLVAGGFDLVGSAIDKVAGWFSSFRDALSKFKVPNWLSRLGGGGTVKFESSESSDGSHYHGIDYVPRDGYKATLHRGEKVLTAQESREHKRGGGGINIAKLADEIIVREDADIERITDALVRKIMQAEEAGA